MYQLIIVDDEKAIRKGIRDYIDWKSMGYEVADIFEDGKEALEYLKNHIVDVVLTDIEMAEVSGLQLAKHIRDNDLPQKVVIISGYKEFEYARKAVEYGAEHYLLKPIRMEEVAEVFAKIKKDLDAYKALEEKKTHAEKNFTELLPELQEHFWISLLVGGLRNKGSMIKRKTVLNIDVDEKQPFALIDLQLDAKEEMFLQHYEGENFHHLINNIAGGENEDIVSFPIFLSDIVIKVIMTTKRQESPEQFRVRVEEQLKEKCDTARSLLKLDILAEIEKIFPNLMGFTEYQCILTRPKTTYDCNDSNLSTEDYERLMQEYKLLMGLINDGEFEELDNLIDTIFHEFRKIPMEQMQKICIDMFSMLSGRLMRMGIDMWKVLNQKLSYQELMSISNMKELKDKVKMLLYDVMDMVKEKRNISSKHFIEEAIQYMKENYSKEISLETIANKFFLNQTYFSRLFKQYTGTTYTDYLIELRMERAKELLSQGKYKVYEVSKMVGYRSEKYFFRIFKQYTGCSPTEYYRGKI